MRRTIIKKLLAWKQKKDRKPLILKGARQVGKTYILKQFADEHFSQCFYINFEKQPEFEEIFEKNLDPHRIVTELELAFKQKINIAEDLLIFDEIQACPKALTSLKYFCEELPALAVCSAGSLLGIHLNPVSFPVGKVDWLDMYPMSFKEFLMGVEEAQLVSLLNATQKNTRIPVIAHQQLWEQLKIYFIVGGLPAVVSTYNANKENLFDALNLVRETQEDLIKDYYSDMAKHSGKVNAMHIDRVWRAVPEQLAKTQNSSANKFKFKGIISGIDRYQRLVNVIDWLLNTGLLIKVSIVDTCQQPLKAFAKQSSFKLFMFDVGLLGAMSGLAPEAILKYDYGTYKGYFAENYVCQELTHSDSKPLYNWQEKSAEVEFLKEVHGEIIPIEVKSGFSTHAKSLKIFADKYHPPLRIILSANQKSINDKANVYHLPLYLAGGIILEKAEESLRT